MENSGTEGNAPVSGQWQNVAERIAAVIRASGIEVFREAVRAVVRERLRVQDERDRREETRCEALKKDGVLYRDGSIPEQPGRDWFFHLEMLRGSIKLPPETALPPEPPKRPEPPACLRDHLPRKGWSDTDKNEAETFHEALAAFKEQEQEFWPQRAKTILPIFEHVKQRGFPTHEEGGFPYELDVCAWLPAELHYDNDPPHKRLLPIPKRALKDAEKMTILAAVYDAHWRGAEKIAPWGVSEEGDAPDGWPSGAERDERRAALGYFMLCREAENLDASELPIVQGWLEEWRLPSKLTSDTARASAQDIPEPPPPPDDTSLVFAPDGDGYFIRGFGAEGHFKATVGLRRLEKLLRDAGRPVLMTTLVSEGAPQRSVSDLDEVVETPEGGEAGFQRDARQPVFDEKALKDIQKELLRLDDAIKEANCSHDTAAVDWLSAEREKIKGCLKKVLRFGGKSRGMTTEMDRLRSAIANSLSAVYKKFRQASPPLGALADHLDLAVRAESPIYIYAPQPIPLWSFDKPSS